MSIDQAADGEVTVALEGTFDASAAAELLRTLAAVRDGEVMIDFTQVRDFRDSAVAVLARGLSKQLRVKGLGRHHERLLRYFGLLPAPSPSLAFWQPEEVALR